MFIAPLKTKGKAMKKLKYFNELDDVKVGDKIKVYDFDCICTSKTDDFIMFHTYLKNNKVGKKSTAFIKVKEGVKGYEYYEWKNINNHTSTKFVNN